MKHNEKYQGEAIAKAFRALFMKSDFQTIINSDQMLKATYSGTPPADHTGIKCPNNRGNTDEYDTINRYVPYLWWFRGSATPVLREDARL